MTALPIERAANTGPLVTIRFDSSSHFASFPDLLMYRPYDRQAFINQITAKVAPVLIRKREKPGWRVHLTATGGEILDRFEKTLITFETMNGYKL